MTNNTHTNIHIHTQTITFTTMRVDIDQANNYNVHNLTDHIHRLHTTIHDLHMTTQDSLSEEQMKESIKSYLTHLQKQNIYKEYSFCLVAHIRSQAKILEFSHRPLRYTQEMYNTGFKLEISPLKIHSTSTAISYKTNNYLDNKIQLSKLACGFHEALRFNENNFLCEGCYSNTFIIDENNHIKTPSLNHGLLSGIMRKKVIDYSKTMGYNIEETNLTMDDLTKAKSVFITNSLMGVMWINEIKEMKNTYEQSPILTKLITTFQPHLLKKE